MRSVGSQLRAILRVHSTIVQVHDKRYSLYTLQSQSRKSTYIPIGPCICLIEEMKNSQPQNYLYFHTNRIINTFLKAMKPIKTFNCKI